MRRVAVTFVLFFIAIQFYRPDKNSAIKDSSSDFLVSIRAPKDIAEIFKRSCYDCHSNYTNYRWFDNIAPISWYIDKKINRAKLSLNFSNWKGYEPWQKRLFIQGAIKYDINTNKMPPKSYLLLHKEAKLSKIEKIRVQKWLESLDLRGRSNVN